MDKIEAVSILRELCVAIQETIEEFPDGAPAGPLYMSLASQGMSLEVFEMIMSALVTTGKVRKSGHQYFPIKRKEGA